MTNHIEKLMEAAGVKPETVTDYELNEYHIYPCLYARKTQELYFARNEVHSKTEYIREQRDTIDKLKQEYEQLQEKYEALKLENQEGYEIVAELNHECEELNNEIIDMNSIIEDAAINLGNKDFTLYDLPFEIKKLRQECKALKSESFTREELIGIQEKDIDRYRKTLEEIEKVINNILNSCLGCNTVSCRPAHNVCEELIKILDIINKAKGSNNDR